MLVSSLDYPLILKSDRHFSPKRPLILNILHKAASQKEKTVPDHFRENLKY
jgi:hypothetical protein